MFLKSIIAIKPIMGGPLVVVGCIGYGKSHKRFRDVFSVPKRPSDRRDCSIFKYHILGFIVLIFIHI